jgi:adenine-specific DNA-methyltransferase
MRSKSEIKQSGATFTPVELARFLAEKITPHIYNDHPKVLDPACGDGVLLEAIYKAWSKTGKPMEMHGYDADKIYLEEAKLRLSNPNIVFSHKDFLEDISLTEGLFTNSQDMGRFDAIIANPPYVRTQILGSSKAQLLAQKFNLRGRVDLYYPFLIGMTHMLKMGGVIGVLTSNRYLSTKSGESIRKFLSSNYEILEVIDLGDTKLFDAAVLPAIFLGRKKADSIKQNKNSARFAKIYEDLNGIESEYNSDNVFEVLKSNQSGCYKVNTKKYNFSTGILKYNEGTKDLWQMLTDSQHEWIQRIESASEGKINKWFKVRVGVKTTADKVFIRNSWDDLGENKPESELIHILISQDNIERWKLDTTKNLSLLYTHNDRNGKKEVINLDEYPRAEKYLEAHREILQGRKYVAAAKRKWFEIWVPQNPSDWARPKLVFPDISVDPRFYFDNKGKIVNGNCYWITANNKIDEKRLLLIQGIANSSVMSKYHDLIFNNKLYSGRRRYFSQYVENYPVPDINNPASQAIINLVDSLNKSEAPMDASTSELDNLVEQAFNLT